MTFHETMSTLESLGTEQNRKIYKRHGAGDVLFGVSFANFGKFKKQIKTDHSLASQLWSSGNADARILATMIADPQAATSAELNVWVHDIQHYGLGDLFATYVAKTPLAGAKMREWIHSPD